MLTKHINAIWMIQIVEIFGYWWASPRHHATTQIDTNMNCTVRVSRPVLTSPFAMSFVWLSGSSVRAGAFTLTGYEPSWPLSAAFCVYLSLSVFIWAYLCHLCLLRWSALRICLCIVSLFCGACWASAPCSAPIWAWCVEICLHILGSTTDWCEFQPNSALIHFIFSGGRTNRTLHFHCFILSPLPPSFAAPFDIFLPISITCCPHSLPRLSIHFM
jgi:hypothetical protein